MPAVAGIVKAKILACASLLAALHTLARFHFGTEVYLIEKTLTGEPSAFPAFVETTAFEGISIWRLTGTKDAITETTEMLETLYPGHEKAAWDDARFMGFSAPVEGKRYEIYELIVFLKKADQ